MLWLKKIYKIGFFHEKKNCFYYYGSNSLSYCFIYLKEKFSFQQWKRKWLCFWVFLVFKLHINKDSQTNTQENNKSFNFQYKTTVDLPSVITNKKLNKNLNTTMNRHKWTRVKSQNKNQDNENVVVGKKLQNRIFFMRKKNCFLWIVCSHFIIYLEGEVFGLNKLKKKMITVWVFLVFKLHIKIHLKLTHTRKTTNPSIFNKNNNWSSLCKNK